MSPQLSDGSGYGYNIMYAFEFHISLYVIRMFAVAGKLYDVCSVDGDCSAAIGNSFCKTATTPICKCNLGYQPDHPKNESCTQRKSNVYW